MEICPKCGKGISSSSLGFNWQSETYHSEWKGQMLHQECWYEALREQSKVIKSCTNCHYYRSISSSEIIDSGLFVPNPKLIRFSSRYCAKFGFSLRGKEAEKCTSYITEDDYKEKALRGEINPQTDANFKICPYCQTKYDLNKISTCPKCGAP